MAQTRRRDSKRRKEVERGIYFYRVDAGLDEAGAPLSFDPEPVLRRIDALPANAMNGRYALDPDGNGVTCRIELGDAPYRLKFSKIRWHELPSMEYQGQEVPLPENHGLAEAVHAMLFYNAPYWFVGCEYNPYGPRMPRLATYLVEKGRCPEVAVMPLIRHDAARRLQALQEVRLVQLHVHPSYVGVMAKVSKGSTIEDFLDSAQVVGRHAVVDVMLRSIPGDPDKLPHELVGYFERLFGRLDVHGGIVDRKIRGKMKGLRRDTGRVDVIDLLNAQFVVKARIPRAGTRTTSLSSPAVYAAIEAAYTAHKDELLVAAGLTLAHGGHHAGLTAAFDWVA